MVEMMNVKVDIKTIESEKNAQKLETRYKIFMDTVSVIRGKLGRPPLDPAKRIMFMSKSI